MAFVFAGRVQPEDFQQPGVCRPPGSVGQPGLRGCLPADPHVYHPHEFCQGLGSRVQVSDMGLGGGWGGGIGNSSCQSIVAWQVERTRASLLHLLLLRCWSTGVPDQHHVQCTDEGTKALGQRGTCLKSHRSLDGTLLASCSGMGDERMPCLRARSLHCLVPLPPNVGLQTPLRNPGAPRSRKLELKTREGRRRSGTL